MSKIDTGLGWACDSEYYVNDANTYLGSESGSFNRTFYKTTAGPAAAFFRLKGGTSAFAGAVLLSTVANNVATNYGGYNNSATINGTTWYLNTSHHIDVVSSYDAAFPTYQQTGSTAEEWITQLITLAGIVTEEAVAIPVQWFTDFQTEPYEDTFNINVF